MLRQAPMGDGQYKYSGLRNGFGLFWKEGGLPAMYGGLTLYLLQYVPCRALL